MSEAESYSIKEMLERVEKKLDTNTTLTSELNTKVGIQNGRVTKQEDWSKEAKIIIEANRKATEEIKDEYKTDKAGMRMAFKIVVGLLVIVPTVCTFVFGLYVKNRDYQIEEKINSTVKQALINNIPSYEIR